MRASGTMRRIQMWMAGALAMGVALAVPPATIHAETPALPVAYVQISGRPNIYAVGGGGAEVLTFDAWVAAGSPAPTTRAATYFKYPWSPVIYAVGGPLHPAPGEVPSIAEPITYLEWQQAGFPTPNVTTWVPLSYVYKWATSDELFVQSPVGEIHKYTYSEWVSARSPEPDRLDGAGFLKLTWAPEIVFIDGDALYDVTYPIWADEAFPTPYSASRFQGDQFYTYGRDPRVYYSGPTMERHITYAEWLAAGRPAPERR